MLKLMQEMNFLISIKRHNYCQVCFESKYSLTQIINSGNPSFVVDCIDNNTTKTALIYYCTTNKIPIIVSCGSAAKTDPSKIKIADISETKSMTFDSPFFQNSNFPKNLDDPLSREMRRNLRQLGISSGIPVVFSTEVPRVKLLPLPDNVLPSDIEEYRTMPNFRIRILPVLGLQIFFFF